ncbi:Cell division protein FtsI/penicillin-binding protein 2 [Ruminococcus sp. SR1/5]|uniref:Cell division protein FtsI/penicillin-binding protein 2 n=1 Tax=Ruminococcus sp. SR1/5 TaxID=657323 RepID=UPI0001CD5ADA|nr:Cell division protein FtsI/penicillin-binding protein 2 [Ruminococcus sp. SR1/5]
MVFLICIMLLLGLVGRLWYLMNVRAEYYSKKAEDLHERERDIKAARGKILDIRGNILADNRTVCTVSVIHSQIKDPEKVIRVLSGALSVKEEEIRKKLKKFLLLKEYRQTWKKALETGSGNMTLRE